MRLIPIRNDLEMQIEDQDIETSDHGTNSKKLESITDNSEIKTNEDEQFLQTAEDSMDIEETYPDQTFENMELNGNNQETKTPEIRIEDAGFERR